MTRKFMILLVATAAVCAQLHAQDAGLEVLQVRQDFYMIAGAGGNIAVQIGPDGVVVVDAGSAEKSDAVLAAIRKLTDQPIRYVINTSAPSPKSGTPVDLTGYWISIVTEDWRYRMVTPAKGDFQSIPLNQEAVKVANTWDPEADERAGNPCKSYGAAATSCSW